MSDVILYTTDDWKNKIDLRLQDGTVWLTQQQIADLFQATKQNISLHLKNIFEDGELVQEATVKESLTVQTEDKREVQRTLTLYDLDTVESDYLETIAKLEKQAKQESRKKGGQA